MMRPPPRSPLFPTRRSSDLLERRADDLLGRLPQAGVDHFHPRVTQRARDDLGATVVAVQTGFGDDDSDFSHKRSEEHTSELQSLAYLVCRLLLEKKK